MFLSAFNEVLFVCFVLGFLGGFFEVLEEERTAQNPFLGLLGYFFFQAVD